MANKFQMSVQERLEQEASRQKVESKKPPQPAPKKTTSKQAQIKKETPIPAPKDKTATQESPLGISDYLYPIQQRQAKNKTFYLDEEVVVAIRKVAREQGVTDSRLVNDILRRILGV